MVWHVIVRDSAVDRAILYLPWQNISFQLIYQLAHEYLFVEGTIMVKILSETKIEIQIVNRGNFNWRIQAEL